MGKINIWYFVYMFLVGVFLSSFNLTSLQFGVLMFIFSAIDLIGGPIKSKNKN